MREFYLSPYFFEKRIQKIISILFVSLFLVISKQAYAVGPSITSTIPATGSLGISVNLPSFYAKFSVPNGYVPNGPTTPVRFQNASTSQVYYEVQISTNLAFSAGNVDVPIPGPLPDNTTIQVVFSTLELLLESGTPRIFTFTTQDMAPAVKSISPSTEIGLRDTAKTITLTFSENITKGTGNILFTNKAGTVLHTIGIGTTAVTVIQNKAFVKVPSNWTLGTQFTVSAPASGFKDATNKNSVAYVSPLYTVYDPAAALQLIGQLPGSKDTVASTATTVKFIFNKPIIQTGITNDVIVLQQSGASEVKFFGSMGSAINGNELSLTYPGGYWPSTGKITITLNGSTFKDGSGNILTAPSTISFFVKCVSLPPVPAPIQGSDFTCASSSAPNLQYSTASIAGVNYVWTTSAPGNTPSITNLYSIYIGSSVGDFGVSVRTRVGPCLSSPVSKSIKAQGPINITGDILGSTTGVTGTNYSFRFFLSNVENVDTLKWYQDGVLKTSDSNPINAYNNFAASSWTTGGTKEIKLVLKNRCGGSQQKTFAVQISSSDVTPPTVSTFSPVNNATSVALGANLVATFSEPIVVGTGTVSVYTSTGALFGSFTLPSANVVFSGSTLTINPNTDLVAGTIYYVNISAGAVKDATGNNFAGITNATTWRFTTASIADVTPPNITSLSPVNNATGVAIGSNLVATFNEAITVGNGFIALYTSTGGVVAAYTLPSANVTISGNTLTINPSSDLANGSSYYMTISSGAITDLAGNSFAGITTQNGWAFTTEAGGDAVPPQIAGLIPANTSTGTDPNANLVLTFSEPVVKVAGKMIQLVQFIGDVVVGNYTTDSPEITISGSTLTINPAFELSAGTKYYVYMASGAVKDAAGNNFAGMTNSGIWSFTTAADNVAPTVVSLSPTNNATNVALGSNLVLTGSESLVKVPGKTIQIVKVSGDVVVGNYTTDSPEVTFSANTMTINPSFNLDANTVYYVYLASGFAKDAAGNFLTGTSTSSAYWRFTTTTITGQEEETANKSISVWPNPVQNELNIQTEGLISVELFDLTGVQVAKGNSSTMDISELASGVYILNVKSTNGSFRKQIVKK